MTHEPPRKPRPASSELPPRSSRRASTPESSAESGDRDPETTSDRPTVTPPFDVEAFARATGPPEREASWPPTSAQPGSTPTARPPAFDAEARTERGERITLTN